MKTFIKKILGRLGYRLVHKHSSELVSNTAGLDVLRENFGNLTRAYEAQLNKAQTASAIPANRQRAELLARGLGTPPSEAYFIVQGLARTAGIAGDVCEFGVAQGETSALIANEIRGTSKRLHLFDSFEGLPAPTQKDQLKNDIFSLGTIENYKGTMACPEDMVLSRMNAVSFPSERYVIHKGFIEALIADKRRMPAMVSFAYVDFDFYEPIKVALEYLNNVMPQGGVIIVDDYDFFSTGAKTAVDEFLASSKQFQMEAPESVFGYFAVLTKL